MLNTHLRETGCCATRPKKEHQVPPHAQQCRIGPNCAMKRDDRLRFMAVILDWEKVINDA